MQVTNSVSRASIRQWRSSQTDESGKWKFRPGVPHGLPHFHVGTRRQHLSSSLFHARLGPRTALRPQLSQTQLMAFRLQSSMDSPIAQPPWPFLPLRGLRNARSATDEVLLVGVGLRDTNDTDDSDMTSREEVFHLKGERGSPGRPNLPTSTRSSHLNVP